MGRLSPPSTSDGPQAFIPEPRAAWLGVAPDTGRHLSYLSAEVGRNQFLRGVYFVS